MASFAFQPSNFGPFQFQPILDGVAYTGIVTWNLFGQRWYLNLYDGSGDLIVCKALVGSPAGLNIQSFSFANGTITLTTADPHGYHIGDTLSLTIAGALPAAYNGVWKMLVTGPSTLTFPLSANPGQASQFGILNNNIDLLFNLGFTSTLVFREASQSFETT